MKDQMILNSAGRPKDTKCICENYLITEYIKAEINKKGEIDKSAIIAGDL